MSWLSGWDYRKSHVINSASGAGTNYQVKIKAHYGSGTDSGEDVYLNEHCRTDFGDVRFTDDDGVTLLDYWMEKKVDSNHAVFWVEVADDLSSSDVTIYIYYGKSDATYTDPSTHGKNTFLKFYDFDTDESSEWTKDVGNWNWDTTNGRLELTTSTSEDRARISSYTPSTGIAIRTRLYGSNSPDANAMDPAIIFGYQDGSNFYMARPNSQYNEVQLYKKVANSFTKIGYSSRTIGDEVWYVLDVAWISASHVKVWLDETLEIDQTTNLESWTSGDVGVRDYYSQSWFDYYFVRKYVSPEPSHGSWGSEETASVSGQPYISRVQQIMGMKTWS